MASEIKLSQFMIKTNSSNDDVDYYWNVLRGGGYFESSADYAGLICYGYGATRKVGKSSLTDKYYWETSASLFSENAPLINAEEWLLQTDYSSKYSKGQKQKDLQKQINDIKEIFKRALPDVEDVDIFLDEAQDSRPKLRFLMPYGWIPFADMGLGYKTMITWILDLVIRLYKRYPESNDPLSEPAIVLVDEIDLHLHPKWQRTIMDFLTQRFPNTQFIVTAHSPLVVQAAQDANIVLLRREGDRVVIENNPEIIDNWRVDQILTSLFELPSARSATLDPLLKRREEILTKPKLTPKDKAELKAIAEQIGHLPTGETPEDIQAMDIIRRAAKL
jgi:predicted ATP-binding protein involved in virulence